MRQRSAIVAVALAIGLTGGPLLHADITPVNYPTPMSAGAVVSGVITNIDPVNQMIQIRDASGMIQTIHVNEHIQILQQGQPVRLDSLRLGDPVTTVTR